MITNLLEYCKNYFIFNRKKLSKLGIYQFVFWFYSKYYVLINKYYRLGDKLVYCPACNYCGIKFINGEICPNCWSSPRYRLLSLYIHNCLNPEKDSLILDVAPNIASRKILDNSTIQYMSTDLDSPVSDTHMDLTSMGYKTNSFDIIICYHVLEHIKNDSDAINEIYRILKPNGIAILQVPFGGKNGHTFELDEYDHTDLKKNMELYGYPTHVRCYGETDYQNKLKSAGFYVKCDEYVNFFSKEEISYYGLDENEILYICKKKI
ncbi:MAG: methyltransferase domain-containing protein [Methanomicrobium sp.]|nr:methyltransferase domain-containing protein [Methanomicrobium sp.]